MAKHQSFEYTDSESRLILVTRHDSEPNIGEIIGNMKYNGVMVHEVSPEFRNDASYDPRFSQEYSERNAVTFLLAAAGFRELDVTSKKPPFPDVQVAFADGKSAYVETAEVIASPSARFNGLLNFVNVGISRAIGSDANLDDKLRGHSIGVRAWMTNDGRYDANAILDEFLDFLRNVDFNFLQKRQMVPFGSAYPNLTSIDAKYHYNILDAISIPRFDPAAHAFAPESLASQVLPILNHKIGRASSYHGSPLWLALYMSDPLGVPELTLDSLEGFAFDFYPFRKIIVGDQRSVVVYTVS